MDMTKYSKRQEMKEMRGEMRDGLKWVMLSKIKMERKKRRHEPLR
jgi:hypothetical protein